MPAATQPTAPAAAAVTPTTPAPSPPATSTPTSTAVTATPALTATAPAVELPPLNELTINLVPVVGGLTRLTSVTPAGDGSGRLFILEQTGRILIIENGAVSPTPFLDIVSLVGSDGIEQGLLGLAFHPDYTNNGFFYVYYTDKQGDTVVARYTVSADSPALADPASAKTLLAFDQPYANHNGGQLAFGPDRYLYIGAGDGGSANDPHNNGQRLDTFLGKILRIDVDGGDPYAIPADNPFVDEADARPEIWTYGWRNPWRFSFDRQTGDLYVADVGQNQYEEVNFEPAGSPGGLNYGWRLMEGLHCFDPSDCDPAAQGLVLPVAEYDHSMGCSVTGGYVYRGAQFPTLTGVYLYADYCNGFIWGLRREADGSWSQAEMLQSGFRVSSFGQDEAGELYVADHVGNLLRIVVQ
jgi:glucose/arabinose dehydrogenase